MMTVLTEATMSSRRTWQDPINQQIVFHHAEIDTYNVATEEKKVQLLI